MSQPWRQPSWQPSRVTRRGDDAGALFLAALVNVPSENEPAFMRVLPGNPEDSYIIHKLEGTQTVGSRMPLGGPFLDQATIDQVKSWIQAGANP